MGSANIQAKIKSGLSKAINKTGSSTSDLIYLVSAVVTGGETPLVPATEVETNVLLVNAIFKSVDANQFAGEILAGDRLLVSDNDVIVGIEIRTAASKSRCEFVRIAVAVRLP